MKFKLLAAIFVFSIAAHCFHSQSKAQDFPQFRGTGGTGVIKDSKLPAEWNKEKALEWKIEVEGAGWSQPILWKDRIYLTTAITGDGSKPKDFAGGARAPQSMGMGAKRPEFEVEWKVICLEAKSGKVLWSTPVGKVQPKHGIHPSNSFATETPACDEKGVYAYLGSLGKVVGLTHEGKSVWEREVGAFKTNNDFGTGSSLAIDSGKIFVQLLSEESADVLCLKTSDGETIWKQTRDAAQKTSWSTPVVWKNKKRTELVVSGGKLVNSYDPLTGDALWSVINVKTATACSICPDENQIYFGGSDPMSKGPLFAVAPGGSGEIAPKRQNQTFETCAWRVPRSGPGMSTPASNGEYVFMTDGSIAICYSASDGSEVYKKRLPGLSSIVACPIVVGDEVVLIDERGNIGAAKLGKEFAFRSLGSLDDVVWATPAATKDALYIRGVKGLYKFKIGEKTPE